jgi:hypothetical protein
MAANVFFPWKGVLFICRQSRGGNFGGILEW